MSPKYRCIALEASATDREEALRLCGAALAAAGCAGMEFADHCLERERKHPTGLPTAIPTAIPHASSPAIKADAVCYLRLKEPVSFQRMDSPGETVLTRSIFNIAVRKADDHLGFLKQIMGLVASDALMRELENTGIEKAAELLKRHLEPERP